MTGSTATREVAFIDITVADYQILVEGVRPGVEIVLLGAGSDPLTQMAEWAQTHSDYDAIHILSHGAAGTLHLGSTSLTNNHLDDPSIQTVLAKIGESLTVDGDLLLYGCNIAADAEGQRFVANLAAVTGADVAASDDFTGSSNLNANWILEERTGDIAATSFGWPIEAYAYLLAAPADQNFDSAGVGDKGSQSYTLNGITYTTNDSLGLNINIVNDGNIASGGDLALGYRSSGVSATIQVSFKTSDGSEFKLNSFVISTGLGDTTVTVKAYRDNQEVASSSVTTASFTTFDVSANSSWENIDEVRMTGADLDIDIDDIDFSPAVLPTPTVTNVTSLTNDGSYTIGNVISIQITFSAPVAVTGTPQLILETGTTDRAADYISGSGTNTLTFNYTVQAGDTSADLNYTSTASLLLNGGTINATGDGTAATLTLPTPGAPGSLAATKSIVIDTTAPGAPSTPDMTSGTDSGTSNTDNLTNDTTPTFTGTAEANSTVTLYDTDGTTQIGSVTADGSGNWSVTTSTLSVGSHTITAKATDVAGNTGIASSGLSITVDTSAPTLNPATSTPADNATDIATDTSPVLVYSENIAFGSSGTIVLYDVTNSSAIETFDVATDQGGNDGQVSISGNTLTVNPTNALVEGTTYAIQIGVGALTDIAGNTISPINDNTTYNFTTVPANTPPVFSSLDGTPTFTEDGSAVVLDSNVTVADVELDALNGSNGDYTGASITIARNGGASSQDVFTNTGLLGSLTESQPFTYNSTTIGTVTTNTGGVLKLTFNASATSAIVDAVLQSISYSNGSDDPPANVTLNWTFHDGEANSTGTNQSTVNITAVNDAPTLSANTSTPMFTEDGTAVTLFSAASSSTVESSQAFKGLTLTVTNVTDTTESLTIDGSTVNLTEGASGTTATNSLSYSVSVAANTATVTLSGGAVSATDMNTLIDTLAYSNSSQNPSTGSTRVVTITSIQDSGGIDTGGVDSTSLNIASTVTVVDNPTTITSATFDWQTGELVLTGTDFSAQGGANNDVDASTLTFSVNGGVNYTLTDTADVEITSPTTAALTLSATDLMHVRGLLNNNGTANSSSADFNLAAADRWLPSAPSEVNITDAINAVTVSNVQTPLITSATYDADTGVLTVTGSNLFKKAGTNNDIDVQKLTFTGQGGGTYTIDSATTDVEITSATHFSMILGGTDKTSVDALLDQIGTLSSGGTSYNLAAAENWLAAADLGATIVDTTTPITVNIAPKIRSATYDASSGTLVVTGTNFQANSSGADVDASKLTLTGEGGVTYTLTDTADVERDSVNQFTLSLSTTDKSALNQILNKNGIASTGGTSFNLDAADDWNTNVTAGDTHDATNSVTVSNVAVPTLTSATYDAGSGVLTINGSGFVKLSGDANDIDVSKLTLTGEGGETYTLTSTSVELTSDTAFNVTLNTADLSGISPIFNKAGTTSTSGTTYNLAGAEDWASGANPAVFVADLTGNGITVSNIPVPAITDATYDTGTGALVVTGSGFLKRDGTANDIVANKFSITGLGGAGAAYTLTDTVNAEITSATRFTLNLSASDKAAVNALINKAGTTSNDSTTYNLAAAEDWAAGADPVVNIADETDNGITATIYAPPSGGGSTTPPNDTTTTTVDGTTVTSTTSTESDGSTTTTTTVPIITEARQEEDTTTELADIPLVQDSSGEAILQISLPVGVGATSQEITGTDAGTLRDLLIAATTPRINESQIFDEILQQGIDSYVPTVQDEKQVTVRTLTFESSGTASDQPILVTGTTGTGEDDSDNPNRQEALVIDVRNLPSGSVLQFDKVEFAIVIGAIKIQGGEGRNFVVGDDSAQYIVLGEGDDLLRGGAGDDTIGSGGEMTACSEVMVTTPFLSVVVRTCYTVAVIAISSPTRAPWINMSSRTIMVRC